MQTARFIPDGGLWSALLLACLFGLLGPGRAVAQEAAPEAGTGSSAALSDFMGEPAGYRELIAEALVEYEAKHFEEARALFRRAHELFPNARTMRGQGMAEFELRNYGNAIQCFESALGSSIRPLAGPLRDETEQLLERARRFVARVRLDLRPAQPASVLVDGVLVHVEPGSVLLLSVGNHSLEIRAESYQPAQRVVSVQGGEEQVIEVLLLPQGRRLDPLPRRSSASNARRVAFGPQVSALAAVRGYADRTPGIGFDGSLWIEFNAWALDLRLGFRTDLTDELRDYFHVPFELSGYRLIPFGDHAFLFGAGTGLTYINERVETTSTIGSFLVTRSHAVVQDKAAGVPLLVRVGVLLFRSSVGSLLTSLDYGITFAELKERSNEQALRFHVGALFGGDR